MDCAMITHQEFAERYLLGKLTPEQRDAYERHYFECERCFQELQQLLAIREELEARPLQAPTPQRDRMTPGAWWRWPALAAVAATLVTIMILGPGYEAVAPAPSAERAVSADPGTARVQVLTALAQVDPPPYEAPVLRGMHDAASTAFREGMKAYVTGDYVAAAAQLREAATADPSRPDIAFFLGASELLAARPDAAQAELERLIAMGETAFTEEAYFYLGKALLRQDRLTDARQEFQRVADTPGVLQAKAKTVLEALARLEPTPTDSALRRNR